MVDTYEERFSFDEIDIDFESLTDVQKLFGRSQKYNFPAVTVYKDTIYFNRAAEKYAPMYYRWRINEEWCVLTPSNSDDKQAYKSWHSNNCLYARLPVGLRGSNLMRGIHKLYKCGNSLAFKRYEFVEDNT
jgi:hypothetical protein